MTDLKKLFRLTIALVIGIIPGFFLNFNSVFSDSGGSLLEVFSMMLLIVVCYVLLGLVFGYIGGKDPLIWAGAISLPAIAILVLYLSHEPMMLVRILANIVVTIIAAWIGAKLGVRIRVKKN